MHGVITHTDETRQPCHAPDIHCELMKHVLHSLISTNMLPQAMHAIRKREPEPIMGQYRKLSHAQRDMTHIFLRSV